MRASPDSPDARPAAPPALPALTLPALPQAAGPAPGTKTVSARNMLRCLAPKAIESTGGFSESGTRTAPDGTRTAPGGSRTAPDGTRIAPDGTRTAPDGGGDKPSRPAETAAVAPETLRCFGGTRAVRQRCDGGDAASPRDGAPIPRPAEPTPTSPPRRVAFPMRLFARKRSSRAAASADGVATRTAPAQLAAEPATAAPGAAFARAIFGGPPAADLPSRRNRKAEAVFI